MQNIHPMISSLGFFYLPFLVYFIAGSWNENEDYTAAWIGQLTLPSYTVAGRPAMDTTQLGKVPDTQVYTDR